MATGRDTVACSLSNGHIVAYHADSLHRVGSIALPATTARMEFVEPNVIAAATASGSLVLWDVRQGAPSLSSSSVNASLESLSTGYNGTLIAVGSSKGKLHFCDLRNGAKWLGTYGSTHRECITDMHFTSRSASTLLCGAEDGLVTVWDTRQPTEELALSALLPTGAPVRRVGYCGDARMGTPSTIFCLSGSETASLWDWENARCLQSYGGSGFRQMLTHALTAAAAVSPPSPCMWVDYLIDAHWDVQDKSLKLAIGNGNGDGALLRTTSQSPERWEPCHFFRSGHRGIIRAWAPNSDSISFTVGEDANLVEWNHDQDLRANAATPLSSNAMNMNCNGSLAIPIDTPERVTTGYIRKSVDMDMGYHRNLKRHKLSTSPLR